jgi:hypothetical protein
LLADAAAAGKGIQTVKITEAEAENTFNTLGRPVIGGWFAGLPEFQALEARERQKFELKK